MMNYKRARLFKTHQNVALIIISPVRSLSRKGMEIKELRRNPGEVRISWIDWLLFVSNLLPVLFPRKNYGTPEIRLGKADVVFSAIKHYILVICS